MSIPAKTLAISCIPATMKGKVWESKYMGQVKRYRVVSQVGAATFSEPYPGYKLYKVKDDSYYNAPEFYLLTREILFNNSLLNADDTDEILDPKPDVGKTHSGQKLCVYRPASTLEKFYRVKDEILGKDPHQGFSRDGVEPHSHHVTLCARPPSLASGYQESGKLTYIFSKVNFKKGYEIPASELKKLNSPYDRRNFDFYLHDDKAYNKRLWAALKASGG